MDFHGRVSVFECIETFSGAIERRLWLIYCEYKRLLFEAAIVLVIEVMVAALDKAWWREFRVKLEVTVRQSQVVV